jgi:hypothetical protein
MAIRIVPIAIKTPKPTKKLVPAPIKMDEKTHPAMIFHKSFLFLIASSCLIYQIYERHRIVVRIRIGRSLERTKPLQKPTCVWKLLR